MSVHISTVALEDLSTVHIRYWDACIAINHKLTPFHSYRWLASWATAYGATSSAQVLIAEDESGQPVGLLPLMRWGGTVRSLSYNASDYTGTVWARNAGPSAAGFAEHLRGVAAVEPVLLWNVRESDPLVAILRSQNWLKLVNRATVSSIGMSTSKFRPWNQLLPVSARELARKRQRLVTLGMRVSFASAVEPSTLEGMVDVHTRAWQRRGKSGSFGDPRRVVFIRQLVDSGLPLLFVLMYLGDRLVSYRFGPIDDRTYYDWNTGTDPEYSRMTPGLVLLNSLVERMVQSERVSTIDFLRGGEDYKRAWQTQSDWVSEYMVVPARSSATGHV